MQDDKLYDMAIIGGGLAGLSLSILMAGKGYNVILFEKEQYPFHKVCGEYISMESWNFLESLGLPLSELNLPKIKNLEVSSPSGNMLKHSLDLGGFGISRYMLDNTLKEIAITQGVILHEQTKADDIIFERDYFNIKTAKGNFSSKVCAGSFGKRSNLDVKWKRHFTISAKGSLQNYVGIKYHVKYPQPADTIALHNFSDGYCGISNIEDGKCCLCYLTISANLKKSGNNIEAMEKNILAINPHLEKIFVQAEKLYDTPLSISQISFQQKSPVENHVLMIGDAAGMITPLCGNGMSRAMHGAKIASEFIDAFLKGKNSRAEMESLYSGAWKKHFSGRLRMGRNIQRFFGNKHVTELFIKSMKLLPSLTQWLIKQTHGKGF
ncbi:MAG: NAD(P)/FAD-dependent oxidoreductase [Ferruginibacter sp.]